MQNTPTTKQLPPTKIEYNDQFVLRPPAASDFQAIEKAFDDSVHDLRVFMDWSHHPLTKEKQVERIIEQYARYFLGIEYELGMFDKRTGEFLFYAGIYPVNRINPRAYEVGFWGSSKHAGKGHATIATKVMIAFLFEYLNVDRIEITSNVENKASLRVVEKCGFKKEGVLRNFYPEGTKEMFQNGYVKERSVSLFSLIPEDRKGLNWYSDILASTLVFPLLKGPVSLQAIKDELREEVYVR